MMHPIVVAKFRNVEYWRFNGQYFKADLYSDGVVQLFRADENGCAIDKHSITSHNMHDRKKTIEWLNDNVK